MLAWLLLCSVAFAQFSTTVETKLGVTGYVDVSLIGDPASPLLLVGQASKPVQTAVGIVSFETPLAEPKLRIYSAGQLVPTRRLPSQPKPQTILHSFAIDRSGTFVGLITGVDFDKKIFLDEDIAEFTIGPNPDPGPGPDPDPDPDPIPDEPLPIAGEGFRVLIVYESSTVSKLPRAQSNILYAQEIRQYLDSKVAVVGTSREYRIWDQDVDTSRVSKIWQDAMKQPRLSVPWIYISNGKQGYSGPLPPTIADAMTLLRRYGG